MIEACSWHICTRRGLKLPLRDIYLYRSHVLRTLVRVGSDEVVREASRAEREGLLQHRGLLRRIRVHDLPHLDLLHGFQSDLCRADEHKKGSGQRSMTEKRGGGKPETSPRESERERERGEEKAHDKAEHEETFNMHEHKTVQTGCETCNIPSQ